VHHADAALAAGTPYEVAPDLAADVVSEWLAMLSDPITTTLKPAFAELRGTGQTIALRPDGDLGWLITRTPEGVRWTRVTEAADVALAGPIRDLLLVLTRRLPVDQVAVTGDRDLIEHWLARTAA
jgi:predicted lipid carrier protein YhbT